MIYRTLLEHEFEKLPAALRVFHSTPGKHSATGILSIHRENAVLAWLVGFPPPGDRVPVQLDVTSTEDQEVWTRRFANIVRSSTQWRAGGLLMEAAGPLRITFEVRACEGGMTFESRRARVWGIPVPLRIDATVRGGETSWEIEVKIAHVGSYQGTVTPTL